MKRVLCIVILALTIPFSFALIGHAHADVFNPNRIIDDAVFDSSSTMNAGQIDNWLNANFPSSCISTNRGFGAPDPTGYSPTTGFTYGGAVSAGRVIYDAGQAYGINPQVLLATLQKEEGLVVGNGPYGCSALAISASVGYGCPDSGGSYSYTGLNPPLYYSNGTPVTAVSGTCVNSAVKAGFSQQVIRAAWLLKFGEQRSKGNINWAVIKGSWDNSDDPQSCYGGPMTQGTWQRCPSGATTYYDGYTSIDGSPVHMDSGATAALYWYTPHFHGNQSFFDLFTGWFGGATVPNAFKIGSDPAVYVQAAGYRFYVPSIEILQDFGFGSGAQSISQSTADNIPPPGAGSGLSTTLGNVVKSPSDADSDGGSIYLVTSGRKYLFTTVQQMADFGFDSSSIHYLPLSFIAAIPYAGTLSNYVQAPNANVFQVSANTKRWILDGPTLQSLNPSGSISILSEALASAIPPGKPLTNSNALIGASGSIYLYSNNNYYYVPTPEVLECWGFMNTLKLPLYNLTNSSSFAPIGSSPPLNCFNQIDASTAYLLNSNNKVLAPNSYGFSSSFANSDLASVINQLPLRQASLGQVLQGTNSPIVWYLENGLKKGIPSLVDLRLLGISAQQIDRVTPGGVNSLPGLGLKMGVGQVVRASDTGTVYVVTSPTTKSWIATGDDFSAYSYSWNSIDNFPSSTIDQFYTTNPNPLSKYMYTSSGGVYLMDVNGCYGLTPSQIDAYGQPHTAAAAGQPYDSSIFPYLNLVNCKNGSIFVKAPNQYTIYKVENGTKRPVSTWSQLQNISGQSNPYIINLSDSTLQTLPTGPVI
jgi:hypothetical protein